MTEERLDLTWWERVDPKAAQVLSIVDELDELTYSFPEDLSPRYRLPDRRIFIDFAENYLDIMVSPDDLPHILADEDVFEDGVIDDYDERGSLKEGLLLVSSREFSVEDGPRVQVFSELTPRGRIPVVVALVVRAHRAALGHPAGDLTLAQEAVAIAQKHGWELHEQVRIAARRRSTAVAGWAERECALWKLIAEFDENFIVQVGPYYVQGRRDGEDVHLEAVSNGYLDVEHQLNPRQVDHMASIGWRTPSTEVPNFHRRLWQPASDAVWSAKMIVRAFRDVYQVDVEDGWCVQPDSPNSSQGAMPQRDPGVTCQGFNPGAPRTVKKAAAARRTSLTDGMTEAAQRAKLAEPDVSPDFMRDSKFTNDAIAKGEVHLEAALRYLEKHPSLPLIEALAKRRDAPREQLRQVALARHKRLPNALQRGRYLASSVMLVEDVEQGFQGIALEIAAALRSPLVTEMLIMQHVLSGNAFIRMAALRAAVRQRVALPLTVLRIARDLPVDESTLTESVTLEQLREVAELLIARGGGAGA